MISAGVFSKLSMTVMESPAASEAKRRGQAMGRGVATLFFICIGIGSIVPHFVRKKQ